MVYLAEPLAVDGQGNIFCGEQLITANCVNTVKQVNRSANEYTSNYSVKVGSLTPGAAAGIAVGSVLVVVGLVLFGIRVATGKIVLTWPSFYLFSKKIKQNSTTLKRSKKRLCPKPDNLVIHSDVVCKTSTFYNPASVVPSCYNGDAPDTALAVGQFGVTHVSQTLQMHFIKPFWTVALVNSAETVKLENTATATYLQVPSAVNVDDNVVQLVPSPSLSPELRLHLVHQAASSAAQAAATAAAATTSSEVPSLTVSATLAVAVPGQRPLNLGSAAQRVKPQFLGGQRFALQTSDKIQQLSEEMAAPATLGMKTLQSRLRGETPTALGQHGVKEKQQRSLTPLETLHFSRPGRPTSGSSRFTTLPIVLTEDQNSRIIHCHRHNVASATDNTTGALKTSKQSGSCNSISLNQVLNASCLTPVTMNGRYPSSTVESLPLFAQANRVQLLSSIGQAASITERFPALPQPLITPTRVKSTLNSTSSQLDEKPYHVMVDLVTFSLD